MKIWLTLLFISFLACSAHANMANPMRYGDRLMEPSGELRKLYIEHEYLTIDLRPVVRKGPAKIEAHYLIYNDSLERTVDLVFIGVNIEEGSYEVTCNGVPVRTNVVADSTLPKEWIVPDSVMNGVKADRRSNNSLRFTLRLSKGNHTIAVRYKAGLRHNVANMPVITWYADYILTPAKQWASFGSLHTTVLLPEGWEAESTPGMIRKGDTLSGEWDIIPNNLLSITFHAPVSFVLGFADTGIPIITLLLCAVLLVRAGMKMGRKFAAGKITILSALFRACAVTVMVPVILLIVIGFIRSMLLSSLAGAQASSGYDYGVLFGLAMMMPLIILVSLILIAFAGTAAHVFERKKALKTE